jgi:hypothetical protein
MTPRDNSPHAEAVRRVADRYIRDAEQRLKQRRTKAAGECLRLLRKLIWEAG